MPQLSTHFAMKTSSPNLPSPHAAALLLAALAVPSSAAVEIRGLRPDHPLDNEVSVSMPMSLKHMDLMDGHGPGWRSASYKSSKSGTSKSGKSSSKSGKSSSKSGKSSSKHGKSSKSTSKSSRSGSDDSSCLDLQDGFECGMAPEVTGLWVGDEKFFDATDNTTYDYCSRALFNPANGKNFLTWNGGYLGDGSVTQPGSCMDVGVNSLGKTIDGAWLPNLSPSEAFILQIEQKKCIDDCDYDVLETADLTGYSVVSKSCGAHLKKDSFRPDEFSCELYQTNLIEDGSGNQEVVVVLTYFTYFGGYDNYVCPEKLTFSQIDLENDPHAQGMALFVLQANDLSDSFNVTNWDCLY